MKVTNIPNDDFHTRQFEKFSAPRTFPAQWDLSELMGPNEAVQEPSESPAPGEQASSYTGEEDPDPTGSEWPRDPFPQPRTFPSEWDLS